MDTQVARSFEAVVIALRRLRPRLRLRGVTIEAGGVRVVHVAGAPPWMWRDLFASLDHADLVQADTGFEELHERPVTPRAERQEARNGGRRLVRREKWD
jgi:hypothetical protein